MSNRPPKVRITRCVCLEREFVDLLPLARAEGWDLDRLSAATGCGTKCGLCRPYLRAMLRTGSTEFHRILVEG